MKKSNWGGYRPGSGQKPKWKSGETKPLRIPLTLHEQVLAFTQLLDSGEKPDEFLSCDLPSHLGNVTESKQEKVTTPQYDSVTLSSQERIPLDNENVTLSSNLKKLLADWRSKASKSSNPKWHHAKKLLAELNQLLNQ
ncbi:MAG: hypothetical protein AB4063_00680 [Crocosphaera sp.]